MKFIINEIISNTISYFICSIIKMLINRIIVNPIKHIWHTYEIGRKVQLNQKIYNLFYKMSNDQERSYMNGYYSGGRDFGDFSNN